VKCKGSDGDNTYDLARCNFVPSSGLAYDPKLVSLNAGGNAFGGVDSQTGQVVDREYCNVDPCPEPGEVKVMNVIQERYDHLKIIMSMTAPGGNFRCGAFPKKVSGAVIEAVQPKAGAGQDWQLKEIRDGTTLLGETSRQIKLNSINNEYKIQKVNFGCSIGGTPQVTQGLCDSTGSFGLIKRIKAFEEYEVVCVQEDRYLEYTVADKYWHTKEILTLRGPTLHVNGYWNYINKKWEGSGCYRDHITQKDLSVGPVQPQNQPHFEGDCKILCEDYHYFGVQGNGEGDFRENLKRTLRLLCVQILEVKTLRACNFKFQS
jgi:hypothetical protein